MTDVMGETRVSQITELLAQLRSCRAEKDLLEARIKDLNVELSELMEEPVQFDDGQGNRYYASVVKPQPRVEVNLDRLREIDENLYVDATKRVLDLAAFHQMLTTGAISTEVAVEVAHTRPVSPYVKFSPLSEAGDE